MRAENIMYNAICTGEGDAWSPKNSHPRSCPVSIYPRLGCVNS